MIEILSLIKNEKIDIIHYDSIRPIKKRVFLMLEKSIIIIDDIQDDLFLRVCKKLIFYIF